MAQRRKQLMPSSSDSEIFDEESSTSSSVITSFESRVSAGDYKKGKKKDTVNKEKSPDRRVARADALASVRRSPRGKEKPSKPKEPESPRGKKQIPSTSRQSTHLRERSPKPSTSKETENPERKKLLQHGRKGQSGHGSKSEPAAEKRGPKIGVKKTTRVSLSNRDERNARGSVGASQNYPHSGDISEESNDDDESDGDNERNQSRAANFSQNEIRPGPSRTNKVSSVSGSTTRRKSAVPKRRRNIVLAEIRKYQKQTKLLLAKMPFARVVREISESYGGFRWQVLGLEALQEAAEIYLVHLFEDAVLCTVHRSRVTLNVLDMRLARRIRSRFESF